MSIDVKKYENIWNFDTTNQKCKYLRQKCYLLAMNLRD